MAEEQIHIQPPPDVIICPPYAEPAQHWLYDQDTGFPEKLAGRRESSYWYKSEAARAGGGQMSFLRQEDHQPLVLVNALREDVRKWRKSGYEHASQVTRQLLRHWWREDRPRRLFFCQLEAVETLIYIREVLAAGKTTRGKVEVSNDAYAALTRGENPFWETWVEGAAQAPRLADVPPGEGAKALARYACKMATGSGKTVVMAMLTSWALCNRGRVPGDTRYPRNVLIVCPNLTIKERLQVLKPGSEGNYYEAFDLVPSALRPELQKGRVLVSNWHFFNPESAHAEGGKSFVVVNKGEETAEAFARARLGDLFEDEPIVVLNDEGHHAYRPKPVGAEEKLSDEEREEREEATVWVSGLDKINAACGVSLCVDLSATPFYIGGSGYPEGSPFPWIVSDFALVDAIESGITKIPRLPSQDTTGRPDPKYFRLWENITRDLKAGEKVSGGKPKPEVVWRKAEDAVLTLAGCWKERFDLIQQARPGTDQTPPVMIVVCDNTNLARHVYLKISGEEEPEEAKPAPGDEDDDDEAPAGRKPRVRPARRYGTGKVLPELLSNTEGGNVTLRIDSRLLAQAESEDPQASRAEAAQALRKVVATVGKPGQPGERVRCVVSVNMLSEGWDANNVTAILGLRAFGSQLLCEQVIGRGLRRMDYTVDPASGLLAPEYVDIYGVPFSLIPFKGRATGAPQPVDTPKNEVKAMHERAGFEIRFPNVEGYVVALERNRVVYRPEKAEAISVNPMETPSAVFVRPQVGYLTRPASEVGGFETEKQDRAEYYASTHPQTIAFEIARQIVGRLTDNQGKLAGMSRAQLFPQVAPMVERYVATKVRNPVHPCEIGLETYAGRIVSVLLNAIEPDASQGEPPILPLLHRYKPIGTTADVHFKTVKPVQATQRSHLNFVACDTQSWEQAAMVQLEMLAVEGAIECYVRNERLEFAIPYEFEGQSRFYTPDFLVRVRPALTLVLEIKGQERAEEPVKHAAAQRWCEAVNNWGKLGRWGFVVCREPGNVHGAVSMLVARYATSQSKKMA